MTGGRTLIFTGEGKGKTTAAIGTALRAYGHGHSIAVVHFIKQQPSGECEAVTDIMLVDDNCILPLWECYHCGNGFVLETPCHADVIKAEHGLIVAEDMLERHSFVVLDEILTAVDLELIEAKSVRRLVKEAPEHVHIILTGRGSYSPFADLADTITEMQCVKHAYNDGVAATKGIEF